jgi:FtsZ-binding cell division protein ZapB
MNPTMLCADCGHSMMTHSSDGCWHHDLGVICGCMIMPPPGASRAGWEAAFVELSQRNSRLKQHVEKLQEQLRVQTERAERLDRENDDRFTRETEYQNRIRALEQRLRDVASYAARDLP